VLILPLHRRLTRANFPFVTAVLILANVLVYAIVQTSDARIAERAAAYYREAGLDRIELPVWSDWLAAHGQRERAAQIRQLATLRPDLVVQALQADTGFVDALHTGRLIDEAEPRHAGWHAQREAFEAIWNRRVADRWVLRFSEFAPARMFGAMFLHGGVGHLLGNMLFLAFLGLLVEGALGPWLFLGVYLLGGLGGQLVSLAWRWGESGTALGASGAIAALMGAYAVLWGRRKVRFFWWFFVAFDYVKAPALILLPLWLGWELFNLVTNTEARVGFDAHAGGIMAGALLAFAVRAAGLERRDFLDADAREEAREEAHTALDRALEHLGRLQIGEARRLLDVLARQQPDSLPVRIALYRCARLSGDAGAWRAAASRVFACASADAADVRAIKSVYDDYVRAPGASSLEAALSLRFVRDWLRLGLDEDALGLLRSLTAADPAAPGLVEAWFTAALRAGEGSAARRERLTEIVQHFPASAQAGKARFLLANGD